MNDNPTTSIVLREQDLGDTFADPAAFAHWQRVANLFASSELIPKHLRGHLPDVLIGLDLARRMKLNPLAVLQNLYVVQGAPGWKTTFLIALANAEGWDLDWEVETLNPARIRWKRRTGSGTVDAEGDNLRVRCVMERAGKKKLGQWVKTEQAIAAGWANNEQYTHSTELMLRWRAAAFAIRAYDPNLLLGLPTAEEQADIHRERIVLQPEPARTRPTVEAQYLEAEEWGAPAPEPTPPAETPPPSERGPSGGSAAVDPRGAVSPEELEEEDRKVPKANAVLEADMIERRLVTQPRGVPISFELAKSALKEELRASKLSDARVVSALMFGAGKKKWELVGEGKDARIILPGGKPVARQPEPKPTIAEALQPDADPFPEFSLSELELLIADEEHALDTMGTPFKTLSSLAETAGLIANESVIQLDGAPREAMGRYLAALRKHRREVTRG